MMRLFAQAMLLSLLLLLVLSVSPASSAVPDGYTPVGPGDTYLALGDSIPLGAEAAANEDGEPGYPVQLLEQLRTFSPTLNSGLSVDDFVLAEVGETTTSMITSTDEMSSQLELALDFIQSERDAGRTVGLVTLTIGGNDALDILPAPFGSGAPLTPTLQRTTDNMDIILESLIAALDGEGDLLIMNYYNPYPGLGFPLPDGDLKMETLTEAGNTIIADAATKYGIPMAEVQAAFVGKEPALLYVQYPYQIPPTSAAAYDFHPRPAGHCVLAEEFYAVSGYEGMFPRCVWSSYIPLLRRE
jgi:lysophospholipase L1-like esterase